MSGRALMYPALVTLALAVLASASALAGPPVVDRSSSDAATTVSKEELEKIPTSRDLQSIVNAVPTPASPSSPPPSSVPPQLQTPTSDGERLLKRLWTEADALGRRAEEAARRCDRNGLAAALQRLYQMEQQVRAMVNSARQAQARGQRPAINPALGVAVHEHIAHIYIPANRLKLQNCGEQLQDVIGGPIFRAPSMPTPRHEVGSTPSMPTPRHEVGSTQPRLDPFNQRILDLHNGERAALGLQPFYWNQSLAAGAQAHADQLARTGQLAHASREGRGAVRENVNQGMRGWNADQMMANWLNEKNLFTPGLFPNVCAGDWYVCAHYTQIIWVETTEIGCGKSETRVYVFLVCRYDPGGNKDGKPVGYVQAPSPRHIVASTPPSPQLRAVVASSPQMPQLRGTAGSTPTMPISDRPPAQVDPFDRALQRLSDARNYNLYHRAAAREYGADAMRRWQEALDRLARDARRESEAARAAGDFATIDAHMAELFAAEVQRLADEARSRESGTPSNRGQPRAPTAENKQTKSFSVMNTGTVAGYYKAVESGDEAGMRLALAKWESLHQDIKRAIVEAAQGRSFTPQLRRLVELEDEVRVRIDSAQQQVERISKTL